MYFSYFRRYLHKRRLLEISPLRWFFSLSFPLFFEIAPDTPLGTSFHKFPLDKGGELLYTVKCNRISVHIYAFLGKYRKILEQNEMKKEYLSWLES